MKQVQESSLNLTDEAITKTGKLWGHLNRFSALGFHKMANLGALIERAAPDGASAEVGVFKGGSALLIKLLRDEKTLYLFDTFGGMPFQGEGDRHRVGDFADTSASLVNELLEGWHRTRFCPGIFPQTAANVAPDEKFGFVHVDGDQYQTTRDALEYFYPRLITGGILAFDDFKFENCPGVEKALVEFMHDKQEQVFHVLPHQAYFTKL